MSGGLNEAERRSSVDDVAPVPPSPRPIGVAILGAASACAFVASVLLVPGVQGILGGLLALVVLAVAWVDARTFIIPNWLALAGLAAGLASAGLDEWSAANALAAAVIRGATVFALFALVRAAYRRLRGRDGLGFGDVKLAGVAAVWLDWIPLAVALEIAALAALVFFGFRRFGPNPLGRDALIPFGVFLGPSIWLGWLLQTLVPVF